MLTARPTIQNNLVLLHLIIWPHFNAAALSADASHYRYMHCRLDVSLEMCRVQGFGHVKIHVLFLSANAHDADCDATSRCLICWLLMGLLALLITALPSSATRETLVVLFAPLHVQCWRCLLRHPRQWTAFICPSSSTVLSLAACWIMHSLHAGSRNCAECVVQIRTWYA